VLRSYKIQYDDHYIIITALSRRRKKRAVIPTYQHTLSGLNAYTNYSVRIAGFTVAFGPYSPVVVMRTGQGGKYSDTDHRMCSSIKGKSVETNTPV